MNAGTKLGLWGALSSLTSPLAALSLALLASGEGWLAQAARLAQEGPLLSVALTAPALLHGVLSVLVWRAAQRMARGRAGRVRGLLLGASGTLGAISFAALGVAIPALLAPLPELVLSSTNDVWMSFHGAPRVGLILGASLGGAALLVNLGSAISLWFLLPMRLRRTAFWALDATLLALSAWLWLEKLTQPEVEHEGARLSASFALGARCGIRLLPRVLDRIEHVGFRSLIAARLLRAKKSGFLAAISALSILAVSVSSCALTTTLSVMGGFRQDLKSKILGNTAHVVIDRAKGEPFGEYRALLERVRQGPEVTGVSPYASGEVMISSASNLAGAVLRGIDPALVRGVSELEANIARTGIGSLDYLVHPEKLSSLTTTQLSLGLGAPSVAKHAADADAPPGPVGRLSEELRELLEQADAEDKARAPLEEPTSAPQRTLPGIIVGRELARSLRLYLGDQVNVVTPLGDLGPSGPMPKARPFRVAGIFYSGMYEYDMKLTYVTLEAAQQFFGGGDVVHGVEVAVRDPERSQAVSAWLESALHARPELRVRAWQELNENLFGALALEKLAMFVALGIAILVASFCIIGTLTLMVQEKGREIAVLKAMGASDQAIVGVFVLEGTLIGSLGSVLGLSLGYVMCFAAERFGVRLNPEVYYIDRLPVTIDGSEFLAVGLSAVLVCLLVTVYPALLASRLRPVDALRYE